MVSQKDFIDAITLSIQALLRNDKPILKLPSNKHSNMNFSYSIINNEIYWSISMHYLNRLFKQTRDEPDEFSFAILDNDEEDNKFTVINDGKFFYPCEEAKEYFNEARSAAGSSVKDTEDV